MPKNLGLYNDDLSTPRKQDVDACYGPNNAPPYPVTSVNGQTGGVNLTASDVGAAPAGYGLGEIVGKTVSDANMAVLSGWYYHYGSTNAPYHGATPLGYGMILASAKQGYVWQTYFANTAGKHVKLQRYSTDNGSTWTEWEYEDPPMNLGVEYRTTERYNEKAVYKKLDTDGVIKWRADGETTWHSDKPISKSVTLSASGWDSSAKTQTVTVSGVLADETKQLITPAPAAASQTAYYNAGIRCTGQAANELTFTAETVPTEDLTIYVTIQEVSVS